MFLSSDARKRTLGNFQCFREHGGPVDRGLCHVASSQWCRMPRGGAVGVAQWARPMGAAAGWTGARAGAVQRRLVCHVADSRWLALDRWQQRVGRCSRRGPWCRERASRDACVVGCRLCGRRACGRDARGVDTGCNAWVRATRQRGVGGCQPPVLWVWATRRSMAGWIRFLLFGATRCDENDPDAGWTGFLRFFL